MSDPLANPLAPVRLWTGHEVSRITVVTVHHRLSHILNTRPMVFLDLADFAHKPGHEMDEDTLRVLPSGWRLGRSMSKEIRLTIEASISGHSNSDDLRLLNPVTGE